MENTKAISPTDRRAKNIQYIKNLNIACMEHLPCVESSSEVQLKDIDVICKRAIACLFSIQLACDICQDNDYDESKEVFLSLLNEYGVENKLLDVEKRLFENQYSKQDALNVAWTYECYWSLVWALGLIDNDDFKIPHDICDCEKAITLVRECKNYEEFKGKCHLRDIEEILDMLDLYFRYHWACVEKRLRPETSIGPLNPEVVMERRRGLEWLVSDKEDWNQISLDT